MPGHARLPLWHDKTPAQKLETLRDQVFDLYRYQLGDAHREIQSMLAAHSPADAKEARDIQLIKELIEAHPNILNRNCEVGHITASAAIVDLATRRALLHWHKRQDRWLQVGGHTDYDTDIAQAALREAREETGLPDLAFYPPRRAPAPIHYDVHSIPETDEMPAHLHLDFRYLLVTEQPNELAPAKGESTRFRWLSFAEALRPGAAIDDSLRRLLSKTAALFDIETDEESA